MNALISIFAIASLLLVTGCGSRDSGGSAELLTKEQFVKRADAICTKGIAKREVAVLAGFQQGEEGGKDTGDPAFVEEMLLVKALPPLEQMSRELASLDAPRSMKAGASAMVAGFRKGINDVRTDPAGIDASVFGGARKEASSLGLTTCNQIY